MKRVIFASAQIFGLTALVILMVNCGQPPPEPTPVVGPESDLSTIAEHLDSSSPTTQRYAIYEICSPTKCGTAFYIRLIEYGGHTSYFIVTPAHLLCENGVYPCSSSAEVRRIAVGDYSDWHETSVLHSDSATDVALLRPVDALRPYPDVDWLDTALSLSAPPSHGAELVAIASNGLAIEIKNDSARKNTCAFSLFCEPMSGQFGPGASGSPVIDNEGHVAGMVLGGLNDDNEFVAVAMGEVIVSVIRDYHYRIGGYRVSSPRSE